MPWPLVPAPADDALALRLRDCPKVLLHEHLDGGLRPATLLELLRARGLASPADDAAALAAWFDERAHAGSLAEYLRGFALTVAAMATPEALARVAYEAAQDAQADGAVLAEFRIAPALFERHGVPLAAAIEALLDGLARARQQLGLPCGLILCVMRERDPAEGARVATQAVRYAGHGPGRGVVGLDLAGPEAGHPPELHDRALAIAREAGLPITLHAGEADEAARVLQAVRLGARRIGHGVRLADALPGGARPDAALLQAVAHSGVHLELCPTSNVHTGAAASLATHPIGALWRAGLSCSFHTDNRLISMVSHTDEAVSLVRHGGLAEADLLAMGRQALAHSFLPAPDRAAAQAAFDVRAGAQARRL